MIKSWIIVLAIAITMVACRNQSRDEQSSGNSNAQESLVRINKYLVKQDADKIKGFISRHGWKMTETKAGLWYEIVENGTGPKCEKGKKVTLSYKVSLLDGTVCYSSATSGNKTFNIGNGGVEAGLEQGILMLKVGDSARFIMPPHLAYGLMGDEDKIPARATLVYELKVLNISDPKLNIHDPK
jgi:FKBP-type peptidyl-prolyl cis-trans isomerase FkpA